MNDRAKHAVFDRVGIGCDHGGFPLKPIILDKLEELGVQYQDFGTDSDESVDYPEFAQKVSEGVSENDLDAGILICGTGRGMAISANKVPGVRASVCSDPYSARLTRAHNDANVLTMGARVIGPAIAEEIIEQFITTRFDGGRHDRRVKKIANIEKKYIR